MSNTSRPAPAIFFSRSTASSAASSMIGPRDVLMIYDAGFLAFLRGQVLAPRNDLHSERARDARGAGTELAQTDDAEGEAFEVEPDGALPRDASLHAGILVADPPGELEHETDGNSGGRVSRCRGAAHHDRTLLGSGDVDRGVAHPRCDQELEVGKLLDHATGKCRALAHGADDLTTLQRLDDVLLPADVLVENLAVEIVRDLRPIGRFERNVLIVVENRAAMARHCRCPCSVGKSAGRKVSPTL